jgi:zinc transporter ZupT
MFFTVYFIPLLYEVIVLFRLLQGAEANTFELSPSTNNLLAATANNRPHWLTDDRKHAIGHDVAGLRNAIDHLLEHMSEPHLDKEHVKEMRIHMDYIDKQINTFHKSIEHVADRWHRNLPNIETQEGDTLPMGLVIPVYMDAATDGFLLGISSTISLKAGIVLSFANCLEMSFLGMAYASRLVKCTGSSFWARTIALYGPPLVMFGMAGLGGAIGSSLQDITALYIAMVAFGSVALLFLVTNELLIEAKEAQGEDEKWYISIMVFAGIYVVLMLDHIL